MKTSSNQTTTLSRDLAGRIQADVVASGLKRGDVFMTVDQISAHYGTSRTITREALNQLKALGVLEGRQRVGLVVDRPDPVELMERWLPMYARMADGDEYRRLSELRCALEIGAIDFALKNATEEQAGQLTAIAQRFEEVTSAQGQTPEADELELEFHRLVLEMSGNPLLAGMHRVLSDYFHAARETDPEWREVSQESVWEHKAIAEAIARRDAEVARTILRRHLERTLR